MEKLNVSALAFGAGVSWGAGMLGLGWIGTMGYGLPLVSGLSSIYIGFAPTLVGGLIGGVWGFVDGAIGGAVLACAYNMASECKLLKASGKKKR